MLKFFSGLSCFCVLITVSPVFAQSSYDGILAPPPAESGTKPAGGYEGVMAGDGTQGVPAGETAQDFSSYIENGAVTTDQKRQKEKEATRQAQAERIRIIKERREARKREQEKIQADMKKQ